MDALLAALDDSPDALVRVRTLLQQDGTLANGLDSSGTSALMHASAAGLAECVAVLLSCSADPRLRRASDGATALTLAAASCKPASICALLRHDVTLLDETDGGGRTALHQPNPNPNPNPSPNPSPNPTLTLAPTRARSLTLSPTLQDGPAPRRDCRERLDRQVLARPVGRGRRTPQRARALD